MFPQEQRLTEILLGMPIGSFRGKSIWDTSGNRLLIDGQTSLALNKGELMKLEPAYIRRQLELYPTTALDEIEYQKILDTFVVCNKSRLQELEYDAISVMIDKAKEFAAQRAVGDAEKPLHVISFSGGKDSTVVFDLVKRHYAGMGEVVGVFGDTTLELPETLDYVKRIQRANKIPIRQEKSRKNFFELSERIGPPSRVMRWCCTIFKTGPINKLYERWGRKSGLAQSVITYYGIRACESSRRKEYDPIAESPKVARQIVASPIFNWGDADIWLYILSHKLDFNGTYKLGFSRVGCWCCPANSLWSGFLSRVYFPALAEPWRDFLVGFAKKIGKPDAEDYVDDGKWKARQGGQGLDSAYRGILSSRPCGDDPHAKTYGLTRPITPELFEYFKPFGLIDHGRGRSILGEVFVLCPRTKDPMLLLQGLIGSKDLRVKVVSHNNPTLLLKWVDCQIRKFQSCELCSGCVAICPQAAISNHPGNMDQRYTIDASRCTHCLECVTHFDTGCLVSKALKVRKGTAR